MPSRKRLADSESVAQERGEPPTSGGEQRGSRTAAETRSLAKKKAGSGVDESGTWTPAFAGQRPPFEKGNQAATKYGDRALLRLRPRAAELTQEIRQLMPIWDDSFEPVLEAASMVGAQCEAALGALAEATNLAELGALDERAARWARVFGQYLDRLGLTPLSQSRLGVFVTRPTVEERDSGRGRCHLCQPFP
jgi:hypothetical protein